MATTTGLTLEEFLKLPETKPGAEYVAGEVVAKPMPTVAHGIIQHLLSLAIGLYLRANPVGIAGPEIRCVFGGGEAKLPDFLFLATDRLGAIDAGGVIRTAPDLAVEVLSPDDRMSEVMAKLRFYLAHGVRLVWLVDPQTRTVMVMTAPAASRILTEEEILDGGDVLPGFAVPVRDILPPPGLPSA